MEGKVLVTGGAGLIGSALIQRLNSIGIDDILVSDYLQSDERWKHLTPLRFDDYLEGDRLLNLLTAGKLEDVRWIFHLGACSSTTERDGRYLIQNNYEYTKSLAEWAIHGHRRFVYASSAATYGDGSQGMQDNVSELSALRPLNMYGYSKHLFDKHSARKGWLSKIVGLKYFNVFGPNEDHKGEMRSVVHKSFESIRDRGFVELFRSHRPDFHDGEQMRDFLYVKDAVNATIHLAQTPDAAGLYNVGSGTPSTWLQLVRPIFRAMGRPEDIRFVDMPESLQAKYQYYTCSDNSRLLSTGWSGPHFSLDVAVQDYVANYLMAGRLLGDEPSTENNAFEEAQNV